MRQLILLIFVISRLEAVYFSDQCPVTCQCDMTALILTINQCTSPSSPITLPYSAALNLSLTESVIITNNKLTSFPSNLCQFKSTLRILDISSNSLNDTITSSTLNCLTKLEFFNASSNLIRVIDVNAFNLTSLIVLDLSKNLISFLPVNIFTAAKTPNLRFILLKNNFLIDIDIWFVFLPNLVRVDLSSNQISKFTNKLGYRPSLLARMNTSAAEINLKSNQITKFDDSVLSDYFLCVSNFDLAYFLNFLSPVVLDQNPLDCSCSSFNLLKQYQFLVNASLIKTSSNLFKAVCATPSIYAGRSIFAFDDFSKACSQSIFATTLPNCVTTTTSTTTTSTTTTTTTNTISIQNPLNPELLIGSVTNQPVMLGLIDDQIGGIVVGFLGAAILIIILLYCLCPIEILACLFGVFPSFYSYCPCKSGVVTNKKYDLFISYNQSSEDWIKKKFLPFLREKNPIRSYFLQYGELNVERDDFNDIIEDAMSNSGCIMLVLSDSYLMKEWQNDAFKSHLRYLLTKRCQDKADKHRFICVQMYDVCDEEVDDYVRQHVQLPRFVSLETDEFYFWPKLDYFLHTNNVNDGEKVQPVNFNNVEVRVNDTIEFKHYNIKAPIVHVPAKGEVSTPQVYTKNEKYKNFDTKRQADILNKQRIKISKQLLPKQEKQDLIDDNDRTDSPTDLVPGIVAKKRNTRIILGKLTKNKEDTLIKVKREQASSIELNVVREPARNVSYSMSGELDYSAEVKQLKSSLKQKSVTFNHDKNTMLELSDRENNNENERVTSDKKKDERTRMMLDDKEQDDYEAILNEIGTTRSKSKSGDGSDADSDDTNTSPD